MTVSLPTRGKYTGGYFSGSMFAWTWMLMLGLAATAMLPHHIKHQSKWFALQSTTLWCAGTRGLMVGNDWLNAPAIGTFNP